MAKKKINNISFEQSIEELETIVSQLEHGELNLEDAMALFERGLALSKHSQNKLQEAEQKIHLLMAENGEDQLVPFEPEINKES